MDNNDRRPTLSLMASIAVVAIVATGCAASRSEPTVQSTLRSNRSTTTAPTSVPTSTSTTTTTTSPLAAPAPGQPVSMPPGFQVVSRVPTTDRVVFLTIDDGLVRDPEFTERFRRAGIPVTIFPLTTAVHADPGFFEGWLDAGAALGDHTITHPNLKRLGAAAQQREICGAADSLEQSLHVRPTLFRPPYGNHNATTAQVAAGCGFRYIVMWRAAVNNGVVQLQAGTSLQPGDIILMHFRKTFDEDFDAALAKAQADGLRFAALTDYLPR